jgi:hypothetical protein
MDQIDLTFEDTFVPDLHKRPDSNVRFDPLDREEFTSAHYHNPHELVPAKAERQRNY